MFIPDILLFFKMDEKILYIKTIIIVPIKSIGCEKLVSPKYNIHLLIIISTIMSHFYCCHR